MRETSSKLSECSDKKFENQKTEIQMKHDMEQLQKQQSDKDKKYKNDLETVNDKLKLVYLLKRTIPDIFLVRTHRHIFLL